MEFGSNEAPTRRMCLRHNDIADVRDDMLRLGTSPAPRFINALEHPLH